MLALLVTFFMLLFNKRMRSLTFNKATAVTLSLASAAGGIAAAVHQNWLGIIGAFGVAVILSVGQYIAAVSTRSSYARLIDLICSLAPVAALTTVAEYFLLLGKEDVEMRCGTLLYLHPNYLGTVSAIIAVLCVYRFFTNPKQRIGYIFSGVCCLICIVLTGSMFAYIEMTVAAFVMLFVARKWKTLSIFTACIALTAVAVYFIPSLIPRLTQADGTLSMRMQIWRASYEMFKQASLFGRGVLSYLHIYTTQGSVNGIYMPQSQHAHSILLDSLISYGIIGTGLFIAYFVAVWKKAAVAVWRNRRSLEAALTVGILVGVIVHGIIDVTLMWVQPGLLFVTVISCCGFLAKNNKEK